ncbi:hypothetical protein [Nonomuraea sp. NPDC049784]|uniref:hypothetical protein n=1 Tax=Nonomuraea sp. NPDC049784 TaxID=3154361 RepID=UPI003402DFCE
MPAQDGARTHEEPQPAQYLAGQRCQERGEEGPILGSEPHPGIRAELPFENGDLVAEGKDLGVLIPIPQR